MQMLQERLDHRIGRRKAVTGETRKAIEAEIIRLRELENPETVDSEVRAWRERVRAEAEAETRASIAKQRAAVVVPVKGVPHRPVVVIRTVDNPMLTDGLIEGAQKGELRAQKTEDVPVNLTLLIGGLSRVRGLTDPQRDAAARYRGLYENSLIGAAGGMDYSQPRVDVSAKATNPADGGIDARRRYAAAVQALGQFNSSIVENVVCHDMSVRDLARRLGVPGGGRSSVRVKDRLLDAVDVLVDHFGLEPKPGKARIRRVRERVPVQWGPGSSGVAVATRDEAIAEAAYSDLCRKAERTDEGD